MSEHKCKGKVWCHTKYLPCDKTARYEHEGRWYCKRHHPPTVQAKLDARNKKWEEDSKSRLQAVKEANEARAEMQRRAAAYGGLIAQRDALLEALKSTGLFLHHCWCDVQMNDHSFEKLNRQMEIVDAAIKAVEETK